ncbi:hypothetical protein vseg_015124 [Gypsophila vaccaria]
MDELCDLIMLEDYSKLFAPMSLENLILPSDLGFMWMNSAFRYGSNELIAATATATTTVTTKEMIASHPYFFCLLHAYIDFIKVGAPPKVGSILEEIEREKDRCMQEVGARTCIGANPELDQFMENYCKILYKYKSDISRSFNEATNFLSNVESELKNLFNNCNLVDYLVYRYYSLYEF